MTRTIAKTLRDKYEVVFATVDPCSYTLVEIIEEEIKKNNPQILFSSFVSLNPDVIAAGKKFGITIVIRTDYKFSDISIELKRRLEGTYPLADYLIAQTEEMGFELKQIRGVKPERVCVLENPLDEEEILQKASEPNPFPENGNFHFLWVGRRTPIKDVETLKRAFNIVHEEYPNTDLTLISEDPNPFRWMKYADCLVISSISEASPNVLREALFLGTDVISTDCSTVIKKVLPSNKVCPIRDVHTLARLMCDVVNSKVCDKFSLRS